MIYPDNFEQKIGFKDIRRLLRGCCLSTLGGELVDRLSWSSDAHQINIWMNQIREFKRIQETEEDFPLDYFFDLRTSLARIKLANTHLDENELFDLKRSLETQEGIIYILRKGEEADLTPENRLNSTPLYPTLNDLSRNCKTFKLLIKRIDGLLDRHGRMSDNASKELYRIRQELHHTEGSISRTLHAVLREAQNSGIIGKDVTPTLRDGRLVIPITAGDKRRISGVVHDESSSGKTVFVEPTEVVEANNRIHELRAEERREIIRILVEVTEEIRPQIDELLKAFHLLAEIDFIRAKCELARSMKAIELDVSDTTTLEWHEAIHPLLQLSLQKKGLSAVPLDIELSKERRLLIISGPNAGGKSVCLKTVGLLQYMIQCGLSVPMKEGSRTGVFNKMMLNIGDEQSIENDLSTYSSHLLAMKQMMRHTNAATLLLIDELGAGTEPQIGGAIAESVLKQLWQKGSWGIVTTHFQNLKRFADEHKGVINGAMLYDRHEMRPLFKLAIGQPGGSFAIEIARKIGLPEEVIEHATSIVGSEYVENEKYLQDIARDKRYWENKRQAIHRREKDIERAMERYEEALSKLSETRKEIIRQAKEQAEQLLSESNQRIEHTIRTIKESQAERTKTRSVRSELNSYKQQLADIDQLHNENSKNIDKEIARIKARKERQLKHKADKKAQKTANNNPPAAVSPIIKEGQAVEIKGLNGNGTVTSIHGKRAEVIIGSMRTMVELSRLTPAANTSTPLKQSQSRPIRAIIEDRNRYFSSELDVRGMRGEEAVLAVEHFLDDAIPVGVGQLRIIHGKGDGILRNLIRQQLATIPAIKDYHDEQVQFGGTGVTIVEL